MIKLEPFTQDNFQQLISWMHSKELLLTIAGNYFSYPLTGNQLEAYLKDTNSCAFNVIDTTETRIIGHAELYKKDNGMYKIDKLIIGDKESRGKKLCQPIMQLLVDYAFNILHAAKIELNVFDWNTAAVKCYERTGFIINTNKTGLFKIDNTTWTALNMTIENKS